MSKRKTSKDDSTPLENEELSERQASGERDKKKQKKARKAEMEEASAQAEKKTHKRKRGDEEEDGSSGYNDRGPKDSIKQGTVSSHEEKDSKKKKKKKAKKEKKKAKKAKKAPSSEDEAEKLSEAKAKKKKKKKSKKEKKAKEERKAIAGDKEKANNNGDSAKEKEEEAGAPSATSNSSNGGSDQGAAGWNNWEASSFGDDARKNKFLRLMGAKKAGDNPSQPPQKKGLFGSLRASTSAPEPSAIDSSMEQKITQDLTSQFQDALQRRNCRGGIGLDSGTKKSDRSTEPHPHPYNGGKTKLHIDDYPKSIKFDD